MSSKRLVGVAVTALAASACELLVNTDGLDDGQRTCDAGCDSGATEAGPDVDAQAYDGQSDAQLDAGDDAMAPPDGGADGGAGCPTGRGPTMVVAAGLCIDATEVTVADYLPFYNAAAGGAVVRPSVCAWKKSTNSGCGGGPTYPVACVDWCDAYAYCAWAGKRLCGAIDGGPLPFSSAGSAAASEWSRACSPDGRTYPYGSTIEPGFCDTKYSDGGDAPRTVPVASLPNCVGGVPGLFDMAGNVEEWIDSCDTHDGGLPSDDCHEGGDAYNYDATGIARCDNNDSDRRDTAGADVGFRCCASL